MYPTEHIEDKFANVRDFTQHQNPRERFWKRTLHALFSLRGLGSEHESIRSTRSNRGRQLTAPMVMNNFVRTDDMIYTDSENQRRMCVSRGYGRTTAFLCKHVLEGWLVPSDLHSHACRHIFGVFKL